MADDRSRVMTVTNPSCMEKNIDGGNVRTDLESMVRDAGEFAVRDWLERNGWEVLEDRLLIDDLIEIEAHRKKESLMVSVMSSIYPVDPGFPTNQQRASLRMMAMSKGADLKLARVWLNEDLTLKDGDVMWSRV